MKEDLNKVNISYQDKEPIAADRVLWRARKTLAESEETFTKFLEVFLQGKRKLKSTHFKRKLKRKMFEISLGR